MSAVTVTRILTGTVAINTLFIVTVSLLCYYTVVMTLYVLLSEPSTILNMLNLHMKERSGDDLFGTLGTLGITAMSAVTVTHILTCTVAINTLFIVTVSLLSYYTLVITLRILISQRRVLAILVLVFYAYCICSVSGQCEEFVPSSKHSMFIFYSLRMFGDSFFIDTNANVDECVKALSKCLKYLEYLANSAPSVCNCADDLTEFITRDVQLMKRKLMAYDEARFAATNAHEEIVALGNCLRAYLAETQYPSNCHCIRAIRALSEHIDSIAARR